jgi:hypothetical protein
MLFWTFALPIPNEDSMQHSMPGKHGLRPIFEKGPLFHDIPFIFKTG